MAEFQLTPAQAAAVETRGGAILVSAAAGSGKTRVLVERLMRQICDTETPHNVDEFLIITFTKKAAAELRSRIAKALADRLAKDPTNRHLQRQLHRIYLAKISTIDSFCSDLLHEYAYYLGLPADFRQADESELQTLREKLVTALLEESYADAETARQLRLLAEMLGDGRSDRKVASLILSVYDETRCHLSESRWISFCLDAVNVKAGQDASQTVWGRYLIDDLHQTVSDLLASYTALCSALEQDTVLCKNYLPAFLQDKALLQRLLAENTWDGLAAVGQPSFARLGTSKGCEHEELLESAKLTRDLCKKKLSVLSEAFYAPSEALFAELEAPAKALGCLFDLVKGFSARYSTEKERLHLQDFSDLEHGALRLLLQKDTLLPTRIAREISQRYTEIMVDEYQDTNEVQDAIFKAISKDGTNRFMVGDVKQSIYRFRLADPTIFLRKYKQYKDYTEATGDNPRKILLSENFRSGKEILEAANAVFTTCMSEAVGDLTYGPDEALAQGREHTPLPYVPVELHCIVTAEDSDEDAPSKTAAEAAFVAARIRKLLDDKTPVRCDDGLRPVCPGDVVILLRSLKSNAQTYLDALQKQGIAGVCDDGASILNTEVAECLTALLQILDNAHQDIPLATVLLSPLFGFSADRLAYLRAKNPGLDLYDALCQASGTDAQSAAFSEALQTLREAARDLPLHALLEKIQQQTCLEEVFGAMEDGKTNLLCLRRLWELAAAYEDGGKRSLREFLAYLDNLKQRGVTAGTAGAGNAVTVMSIHKSKGLEFPVVVLADLSRRFNMDDASQPVLLHPKFGVACDIYDEAYRMRYPSAAKKAVAEKLRADSLSEELRVLYVAMTRPQDCLIMTYCAATLREKLKKLAYRRENTPGTIIVKDAACPGDWVLATALGRTEAGALLNYAQVYPETSVSDCPWRIELHENPGQTVGVAEAPASPGDVPSVDLRMLEFAYPYRKAAAVPGKMTATQLKGRLPDEELSDGYSAPAPVQFRQPPLFTEDRPLTPTQRGTATHLAMQYLDFAKTESVQAIAQELRRMVQERFLTQKQADAVSPEKLRAVFAGALGDRIRCADRVIREFKFSVLVDAGEYFDAEAGEQTMLQGVTDCCLIKDGALTVIDFKTDRIRPGEEATSAARYKPQLDAYTLALTRIFGMPVATRILYFFETDTMIEVAR